MKDSFVHRGKRKLMVEYLRDSMKIRDTRTLEAMNSVPRHLFLESVFGEFA